MLSERSTSWANSPCSPQSIQPIRSTYYDLTVVRFKAWKWGALIMNTAHTHSAPPPPPPAISLFSSRRSPLPALNSTTRPATAQTEDDCIALAGCDSSASVMDRSQHACVKISCWGTYFEWKKKRLSDVGWNLGGINNLLLAAVCV